MSILKKMLAGLAAASLLASTAQAADLVTNGGFETGDFTGWTQSGNTGFTGVTGVAHSGSYGAYFGPVGSDGIISQTLATTSGATYHLSYWLNSSGGTPNHFAAAINGSDLFSITDIAAQPFTAYDFTFIGTGSDVLSFSLRNDPNYLFIDDISVAQTTNVPEPASLALIGLGLAGLGLSRRRKA